MNEQLIEIMLNEGYKMAYIAKKVGCDITTVARRKEKMGLVGDYKYWTDEEREKLHRMLSEGMTYRQIGTVLGRSKNSIGMELVNERKRKNG